MYETSLWQIAHAATRTRTSPGPGAASSTSSRSSGRPSARQTAAFTPLAGADRRPDVCDELRRPRHGLRVLLENREERFLAPAGLGLLARRVVRLRSPVDEDADQSLRAVEPPPEVVPLA